MSPETRANWLSTGIGAFAGSLYGLAAYAWFERFGDVMVWSFLILVPFALGVIGGAVTRRSEGLGRALVRALLSVAGFAAVTLALAWEGIICLIFGLPILAGAALIGAALAFWLRGALWRASGVLLALSLPFAAAGVERARPVEARYRTTENSIEIAASPMQVWNQIKRVPHIRPQELQISWSHLIGLPKPDAAVLDHDGVGGVRTATFEGGMRFVETVTEWEPGRRLAFRIQARDPGQLDPHIQVGGEAFDVLSGRYDIEVVAPGKLVLHLTSTQLVHTHLNGYVSFWVGAMMSDLQQTILRVIRERSENPPGMI